MRHLLILAALLVLSLPLRAAEGPVATILCYHEVDAFPHTTIPRRSAVGAPADEQRRYTVTTAAFREQLDYLEANDYHVIPLTELSDYLHRRIASLPPRAVVITVDDGWLCAYTTIFPALQKRKMPFTLFVYPHIVGLGTHAVTWLQIAEMAKAPGVEIAGHTFNHPFLTQKNNPAVAGPGYDAFLEEELQESKEVITKATKKPVRSLSYPYGDYDEAVVRAVEDYRYEAAVTTERGPIERSTPPLRLKRYLLHNDTTLAEFKTFLLP
jgi:peptidoglycan/xylan/chitin deacetylase (PgdA/CDA1 family)